MSADNSSPLPAFRELALSDPVLKALDDVGYETPSPIQASTIPHILNGEDVLGQAQTGTGKTAAFALPLLSNIDLKQKTPQVMVLAPTRELALQVAEAFQRYAAHMKGFHVLPIYGGQDYRTQLHQLKRGVHVVVGTPGRVMDHMRRGTLDLTSLKCLVLDEADEMLRMGFIDDVEWILQQTPEQRQVALFSATMPPVIRRIAQQHLRDAKEITIKLRTTTAESIRQRYWVVSGTHKLDALTRILEAEPFDGMIVFVRTKTATVELAEKLEARGYATAALNGDIVQKQRERTVEQLKQGKLDIVIATDVAARGLDVQRISHVINYDIPYDTEAYVHRIGRTGRAGRSGDAILFVAPRERHLLRSIEKATNQKIGVMELPSTESINDIRIARFSQRITDTLAEDDTNFSFFYQLMEQYQQEHNIPALEVAAALAKLLQGDTPLLLDKKADVPVRSFDDKSERGKGQKGKPNRRERGAERPSRRADSELEAGMQRYRIEVGHMHGVKPGNIVGAIANEAGLDSKNIGRINISDDHSTVDLPSGMPDEIFRDLKQARVAGQKLNISRAEGQVRKGSAKPGKKKPAKSGSRAHSQANSRAGSKTGSKPGAKSGSKPKHKPKAKPDKSK